MLYEFNKIICNTIKSEIDAKITGKSTVVLIDDLLIVDIIPRDLSERVFRCTFRNIESELNHGVTLKDYAQAILTKYQHRIYKRYFKLTIDNP